MIGILYLGAELNFPGCRIMINFNGEYWASQKYVPAFDQFGKMAIYLVNCTQYQTNKLNPDRLRSAGIRVDIKLALK